MNDWILIVVSDGSGQYTALRELSTAKKEELEGLRVGVAADWRDFPAERITAAKYLAHHHNQSRENTRPQQIVAPFTSDNHVLAEKIRKLIKEPTTENRAAVEEEIGRRSSKAAALCCLRLADDALFFEGNLKIPAPEELEDKLDLLGKDAKKVVEVFLKRPGAETARAVKEALSNTGGG